MEGAGGRAGRGERAARGAAAPRAGRGRGRGAAAAPARSASRGRRRGSAGGAASPHAPREDAAASRDGSPAGKPAAAGERGPVRSSRARPAAKAAATDGAELPAPRPRAARRGAAGPDCRGAAAGAAGAAAGAAPRRPPAAAGALRLREVLSQLSLGRQDVSEASVLVNQVVAQLLQGVRSRGGSFGSLEKFSAGSYYEHVKISEPNEFDIMLTMPVTRLQLDECDGTGAFYYLTFKRNPKERYLSKFLDEDGKLSALKMLEALRKIIKEEVKNIKNVEVTVTRKKAGSPAITLLIKKPPAEISVDIILALEVQQSWPPSTKNGLHIEQWLGRKVRKNFRYEKLYLVAKQNKEEKVLRDSDTTAVYQFNNLLLNTLGNTWRLSFSHIEKEIMKNHGSAKTCCESDGAKCCRKDCLKLLKYLLEQLKTKYKKELEKFCSYHVKTAFFHSCVIWPHDKDWQWADLDHCFHQYLGYFLDCLQSSQLPHFFIPQYNLLSLKDKASNDFLSREINYQINNRFPIFQRDN